MRCFVPGCTETPIRPVRLLIGGEYIIARWCAPHAAEYRIDEAEIELPVELVQRAQERL
jgi:hypothetical protein